MCDTQMHQPKAGDEVVSLEKLVYDPSLTKACREVKVYGPVLPVMLHRRRKQGVVSPL